MAPPLGQSWSAFKQAEMLALHGIFPPIPTPFASDGTIEFDQLAANLKRWGVWPLAGYVVGGSNGEAVSLNADERVQVVERVRAEIGSHRMLIAGAGTQSTRTTIALARRMAEVGADAVIVVTPSYYRPALSPAAFIAHYRQVADSAPLPVVLYNVPVYTGVDLPAEAVRALAEHPNIVGIKESGGSVAKIAQMVAETADDFQVLAGSASFFLPALTVGAVGCVPALACIAAQPVFDLWQAYLAGELDQARQLQASLIQPNAAVTSRFGVAGLKAALDQIGMYGGPVRSPLQPLSDADRDALAAVLRPLLGVATHSS